MGFGQGGVERVKSVKMNRAQLNNRKGKGYFNSPQNSENVFDKFVDHTQMSPDEFPAFKKELSLKVKKRTRNFYLTFAIAVILVILVITLFIYLLKLI